jgi:hypothetical protein
MEDMEDMGIWQELWLRPDANRPGHFRKPHPTYVLKPSEKEKVLEVIARLRTPTDYAGNIQAHVADWKLWFLKSHDCHILMQQV